MRKIVLYLLSCVLLVFTTSTAIAIDFNGYTGPIEIKLTDYTFIDPPDPDDPTYLYADDGVDGTVDTTSVRELRFVATIDLIKVPGGGGAILWHPSTEGELVAIGHGLEVANVVLGLPQIAYYDPSSNGAHLDIYFDTTPDFDPSKGPSEFGPTVGARTYPTVTDTGADDPDNSLWLSTDFVPFLDTDDSDQTAGQADVYKTTILCDIHGVAGPGFLVVTGGSAMSMFDSGIGNTPGDSMGNGDLPFDINFVAPNLHFEPQWGEPAWDTWGWTADSHDPMLAIIVPEQGGEGCTPGYWKSKKHLDSWDPTGLSPTDDFDATFGVDFFEPDITLLQAVRAKGGGINLVARHGTAGLLNALHPAVNYPFTVAEVIAFVQTGDMAELVEANELSATCPAEID